MFVGVCVCVCQWMAVGLSGRRGPSAVQTVDATDVDAATILLRPAPVDSVPAPMSTLIFARYIVTPTAQHFYTVRLFTP